ncbi:MAG: hypothetical protein HRF43_19125 [Phycisphaerae bacterium]|jgi:hypothetical protein
MRRLLFFNVVMGLAVPVWAQAPAGPADAEDPDDQPSPYGIRFTPGMARGLATVFTRQVLVRHYEMDEARSEEAIEVLTRRFMKTAHANNEKGQEFFEWALTEALRLQTEESARRSPGMPVEFGQGMAQRVLPMMPVVREFIDGTAQDIRPFLGLKAQLKLTGELTVFKMGLDAFEKNMEKWARGEVDPFSDPFRPDENQEIRKDEQGQSRELKDARQNAEAWSNRPPGGEWDAYVNEAKKYYEFDASQSATADSILRDYKARAAIAVGDDEAWKARLYRNRLWAQFAWQLPGRWNNPLRTLVDRDYEKMREPIEALGEELKQRIDEVATAAQREAAARRMQALLVEKGFGPEQLKSASSRPPALSEADQ